MNRHTKHYQDIRDGFVLREKEDEEVVEEDGDEEEDEEEESFLGISGK